MANQAKLVAEAEELQRTIMEETQRVSACMNRDLSYRRPIRERKPTEKARLLLDEELFKGQRRFQQAYESWKQGVRSVRTQLKTEMTENDIGVAMDQVEDQHSRLSKIFVSLRDKDGTTSELVRKMDASTAVTQDLMSLMRHRLTEVGDEWDEQTERRRIHATLDKSFAGSVYGSLMAPSIAPSHRSSKSDSSSSSIEAKRIKASVHLAAKEAELKAMEEEEAERERLERTIEAQRKEIRRLEMQKEVKVARAKVVAYDRELSELPAPVPDVGLSNLPQATSSPKMMPSAILNPAATPFTPRSPGVADCSSFAQALQTSLCLSRLPLPEPSVFDGDPLHYTEWKASFITLIDNKTITPEEKFFYLKKYAGKTAGKAIQGFLLTHTDDSYEAAWRTLEERFGNPFLQQKAFRDKLENWPAIASNDGEALREYADYLQGCLKAMPRIPSLSILNDCMENKRMMDKLPNWATTRWNRKVTNHIQDTGVYPSFKQFVEFVDGEARFACNPVSPLKADSKREPKRKQASVMATTSVQPAKDNSNKSEATDKAKDNPVKTCPFCSLTDHYLPKCPTFTKKSIDERKKYVRENRRCFGCLRVGHNSRDCKHRHTCQTCQRRHPTVLHEDNNPTETAVSHRIATGERSTSMIVPVWVSSQDTPEVEVLTYALLDTQSDTSFVLEDLAGTLPVVKSPVKLKLSTMTSSSTISCAAVSNLLVRGMNSQTSVPIKRAYTRDIIPMDRQHIPTNGTAEAWPHLRDIAHQIPPLQECDVGMLIGYDCPQALAPQHVIRGEDDQPFAVQTQLGWSVVGVTTNPMSHSVVHGECFRITTTESPCLAPSNIIRVLESDFSEKHHTDKALSQDDLRFLSTLGSSVRQKDDGHLEMPLPFRERPQMPNNRKLAEVRLQHLKRRLDRDKQFREDYTGFMDEIINGKYAERITTGAPEGAINYIPHHGVYHPRKNKLRVVFDCSAEFAATSLNNHLLKGPDLINNLVGILLRFRKHEVALLCDLEKMFFQFRVCQEDRDYLRFLWWEDGDTSKEPVDFRMVVHLFGAASSPGCANFGLKYLAKQFQDKSPSASKFVDRDFYMDDGVTSTPSPSDAVKLAEEARDLCATGGLRLHKFASNNREVLESLPKQERSKEVKDLNLDFDDLPLERALGISWNTMTDTFCFKTPPRHQPATRRGILSTVASLYDPLGFVSPVILIGKRVLQEMCRSKTGWDDPINETLSPRWEKWRNELLHLESLAIPRCYHPAGFGEPHKVELHHFSDASVTGYGQCSYLRIVSKAGSVHCSLAFSKARVAPTKVVTIPRLELTAAVVSAKVSVMLKEELDYQNIEHFFWTDSQVVLGYIKNEARKFHTFVANRVEIIRERSAPDQWRYVPTDNNPADMASRGVSPADLANSNWFCGPDFLWKNKVECREVDSTLHPEDPEVRAVTLAGVSARKEPSLLDRFARFSDWTRLIKALSLLRRVVARGARISASVQERKETEIYVIKLVQQEPFSEEIIRLRRDGEVSSSSPIRALSPFLDDSGVLRVGGRLGKSTLHEDIKQPVILPKGSHVTHLIAKHFHCKTQHQGRGQTLNEVRANGYWILSSSRVVGDLIRNCVSCRKLRRPEEEQKMASLPKERVDPSPPFTNVGMDCFGPFKVKRARSEVKRYGLLFTCLCSRGIHIEMLDDMSTDAFINGLRCFLALRGSVRTIKCDQGSNFVGAKNELNLEKMKSYLLNRDCDFVFNVPHASHAGGVWERQIKTVRNVLRATIDLASNRLDDSSLRTFFYEAMAIINSRPLSVANLNDPLGEPPLTPNHLITMKTIVPSPPGAFVREDLYARKRWRRVQYLMDQFWSRWRKEYMLNLQRRQKWALPRRNLQAGDIVLLMEPDSPRMQWPMGIIVSTVADSDGLVRKVRVRVASKHMDKTGRQISAPSEYDRPIQKVVLLVER